MGGKPDLTRTDERALTAIYPSLRHKRVVITGGGSGIGASFVEAFAHQGAQVFFLDIAVSESEKLIDSLDHCDYRPKFYPCDLCDIASLKAVFQAIEEEAGAVQVLVNNAANDDRHVLADVTPDYWDERIAVNLRHQFFCAQAVSPGMRRMGGGVILNLGSVSWHLAMGNLSIYMSAKAGIEGLTRGLARDLGADGIRVNCIVPGDIRTPRQSKLWHSPEAEAKIVAAQCLNRRINPRHVASMALFLASVDAECCSGQAYFVDAGRFGL